MVTLGQLPLEQKVRWRIDRINGASYRRTWFGTEQQLKLISMAEGTFAESIEFDPGNGGKCSLVATYANQAGPNDPEVARETQEIDTDVLQQSIFLNSTFKALTSREQLLIRKVWENQETYADALTVFQAPLITVSGKLTGGIRPAYLTLALEAYNLLIMGVESFENYAYSLRRTRTVSRRYPGTLSLDEVNTLWSTEQLVAYTGNPTLFEIPSVTLGPEDNVDPETGIPKNLFPGWRMKVCRVTDVSDGSRQMIEEWQLAKWSKRLYALKPTA